MPGPAVEPLIGRWSASRGHLWEVTAGDIREGLQQWRLTLTGAEALPNFVDAPVRPGSDFLRETAK